MRVSLWSVSLALLLTSVAGCGSTPAGGRDGGPPPFDLRDGGAPDAGAPDAGAPAACERLAGFAGGQRLISAHARGALLSSALDRAVILTHDPNGQGEVVSVSLPSGAATPALATGVRQIQWVLGETAVLAASGLVLNTQVLTFIPLNGETARVIARNVCAFSVSPNSARLYAVRDCTTVRGTLVVIQLPSGETETIASGVAVYPPALSSDGRHAAFVAEYSQDPTSPCSGRGSLDLIDDVALTCTRVQRDSVLPSGLAFTPTGQLLFQQADASCPPREQKLMAFTPGIPTPVSIASQADTLTLGFEGPSLSPDGRHLLAATPQPSAGGTGSELFAIRTDGSGRSTLASDLRFFITAVFAYQPWRFTASGLHVLYTTAQEARPPAMGLAAVAVGGGAPTGLTNSVYQGQYEPSPRPDEAAFIEISSTAATTAVVASLAGTRRASFAGGGIAQSPHFTPDGRALLFVHREPASGFYSLRYLPVPGDRTESLGLWSVSRLGTGFPYFRPFVMDPSGCAVLYDTSEGATPGTQLVLLPR